MGRGGWVDPIAEVGPGKLGVIQGGFAFAIGAMGPKLNTLLDVTIVYLDGAKGIWDLLCGRMGRVLVEVRQLTVPPQFFHGSYENDPAFRKEFQDWIAEIWAYKDRRIDEMKAVAAGV